MPRRPRTPAFSTSYGRRSRTAQGNFPLSDNRMPTLQGKYKCPPHFDSMATITSPNPRADRPPARVVYWDTSIMLARGPRRTTTDLFATFTIGDAKMPGVAADDIGKVARDFQEGNPRTRASYGASPGETISERAWRAALRSRGAT